MTSCISSILVLLNWLFVDVVNPLLYGFVLECEACFLDILETLPTGLLGHWGSETATKISEL